MKVLKFNIKKGIFHYITNDLNTDTHSHPVMEIINAPNGKFSIETDFGMQNNLTFAIIDVNTNHKMFSEQNEIELLLIESNNTKLTEFLFNRDFKLKHGIFTSTETGSRVELMFDLHNFSDKENLKLTNDKRVYDCIQIIETENLDYNKLITTLSSRTFLSESRISHLFKENIGISIKKYLVWSRMKNALEFLLSKQTNLKEASFEAGFTDQAHLSKCFKNMLGKSPIRVFNSRIIQL
jgi:AraC-like DNA-binding protein